MLASWSRALAAARRTPWARVSATHAPPSLPKSPRTRCERRSRSCSPTSRARPRSGERLDPEAFRRVMARYFERRAARRGAPRRHRREVHRRRGDGGLRRPAVHEDDALRAVRAAAELRDSLDGLNAALERDYGVSLELRTGVNTGEVVAGTRRAPGHRRCRQCRRPARAGRRAGRDPARRADRRPGARRGRGRGR